MLHGIGSGYQNLVGRDRSADNLRAGDPVTGGGGVCLEVQALQAVCVVQCAARLP